MSGYVEKYIPMVRFLSRILGKNCEIVLHDLSDAESSIVAIENGHLSGRRIGGSATDYVLKTLHSGAYKTKDFETNYIAKTAEKTFSSSSFFIKNDEGEVVGTLCINIDIEPYKEAYELLSNFIGNSLGGVAEGSDAQERLLGNPSDIVSSMIEQEVSKINVPVQRLSAKEKTDIVRELVSKGVFQLKGAASEVGKALGVSEPTVYRYVNKVK